MFPVMRGPSVPWSVMAPHESMANVNHGQTLERLAERGGLSPGEAWAVVSGTKLDGRETPELWEEYSAKWLEFASVANSDAQALRDARLALARIVEIADSHRSQGFALSLLGEVREVAERALRGPGMKGPL